MAVAWHLMAVRAVMIVFVAIGVMMLLSTKTKTTKTVMLVMTKNEAHIIHRFLASVRAALTNDIFICDTGSTDATFALASYRTRNGFVNFEQARNECLGALRDAAKHNPQWQWVALADADYEVEHIADDEPAYDVNVIQISGGNALPMLIRASVFFESCRYRLWTHEFLECTNGTYGYYNGFRYIDHEDGASRPQKLDRDIGLLRSWLDQVNETDLRPRALYYLARAYEDKGSHERALQTYLRHNAEQTHTNYVFYAYYRIARIRVQSFITRCDADAAVCTNTTEISRVEQAFLEAYHTYDGYFRREPLYYLAWVHRIRGWYHKCVLYASAGLALPPIDQQRMPLFIEYAYYNNDTALRAERDYCVEKIKSYK